MNKFLAIFCIILQFNGIKNEDLPSFDILSAPDLLIVGENSEILLRLR